MQNHFNGGVCDFDEEMQRLIQLDAELAGTILLSYIQLPWSWRLQVRNKALPHRVTPTPQKTSRLQKRTVV